MPTVKPFRALRPKSSEAAQIAAPPYDVLSSDEARAMAAGQPLSFLHVSKPEIDLPAGVNVHSPEVYAKGGDNFKKLMAEGHLARDKQESFYLYRQSAGGHSQTGLVAVVSCEDYRSGRIKKHEFTQPEKEDDRVRHLEALGAQTGPAFLAYRSDPKLDGILAEQAKLEPWADFTAPDGVRHTCWSVESQHAARAIAEGFGALPTFYIADGHHRSAAAFRLSEKMSSSVPNSLGDEPFRFFLAVIFPHHQLRILAYNRLVKDLRGLSPKAFLEKLRDLGELQPAASPIPDAPQSMAVFVAGKWYRFAWARRLVEAADRIGRLDVSLLQNHVLHPLLGIEDPRRDARLKFVGGIRGAGELEKAVESGDYAAAFSMFPTSMEDLMAVADQGSVMPPKSTWFEPKLRDGLFSHLLN